jgi:phosphoribosyl 1,2-cyclic phosphodiesterase
MPKTAAKLSFWGVRGSTPTVDRSTWRYGGNTPCLELETPEGKRIILDCGTGLRVLGNRWLEAYPHDAIEASIFVTHYHWDHIQGIPFFAPFYPAQNHFHFYSFQSQHLGRNSLQQVLEAQMARPYFPVDLSVMSAGRQFTEIAGGDTLALGATRVTACWLNHPQGCLGFRFETSGGTIVYATDNEPGVPELDRNLLKLAEGADIFINDAQYSPEQLAGSRKGWGHSSWLEGVKVAREAGVRNLVLFHHDPDSTDKIVDSLLHDARQKSAHVWAAAEGMVMTLGEQRVEVAIRESRTGERRKMFFHATVNGSEDSGRAFEEQSAIHELSLHGAQLFLTHAPRLQSEIRIEIDGPTEEHNPRGRILLRGYVVRREASPRDNLTTVCVVFTQEVDRA